MIQAVTFDVTHTLIHCPRLGEIYAEVLGRHGVEVAPAEALRLIGEVWRELACSADPTSDRFSAHPEGPRGWWQRFLERFCEHLGAPPPTRFAAAELFYRFGSGDAWEVYPEVPDVLDALRDRGLRLGVISNWDTRLPELLRQLDLARRFAAVVYSSAVGVEKPDSRIFRRALRELGVEARAALHIGDSRLEDVEGAIAAGMRALLLIRGRRDPVSGRGAPVGSPLGETDTALKPVGSPLGEIDTSRRSQVRAAEASGLRDLSPLPALVAAGRAHGAGSS